MYKQLFFLHRSENDKAIPHFKDVILNHLKEISGKEIILAKVESNLLLDQKYSYFFEVEFESKDKMNELMNTQAGKQLTKALMDFHQIITVIAVNYDHKV
jgi:prephenate dehydratase